MNYIFTNWYQLHIDFREWKENIEKEELCFYRIRTAKTVSSSSNIKQT